MAEVDELRAAAAAALEAKAAAMPEEQRATYREKASAIAQAIADSAVGGQLDVWLQDFDDATAYYYSGCDTFRVPYTLADDGTVTLGEPVEVEPVVTYEPVTDADDRAAAELERRKARATDLKGLVEHRMFPASEMEMRASDDGTILRFTGYASVTEHPYPVGPYTETIKRGAFKRTLSENPDVQLLINHGVGGQLPLARTRSGTLRLTEDERGLRVDADLDPEDPDVIALKRKMDRGDIDQMSFAFQSTLEDWNDDYTERAIRGASIHRGDVSIVNMGANEASTASLRELVGAFEQRAAGQDTTEAMKAARDGLDRLISESDVKPPPEPEPEPVERAWSMPSEDYLSDMQERVLILRGGRHA